MQSPVTILNSEHLNKATALAERLVWLGITFNFSLVGSQYTVTVAEADVKVALEGAAS